MYLCFCTTRLFYLRPPFANTTPYGIPRSPFPELLHLFFYPSWLSSISSNIFVPAIKACNEILKLSSIDTGFPNALLLTSNAKPSKKLRNVLIRWSQFSFEIFNVVKVLYIIENIFSVAPCVSSFWNLLYQSIVLKTPGFSAAYL